MYEYIKGEIAEISPSFVIVETAGIGYLINISLNTYEKIYNSKNVKIFIHQVIREDSNSFFGFADKSEREIFRQLISVSGIGANTARLMLSSLKPAEIVRAILKEDENTIKSVKGIGLKTAQRVIIDLKDKVSKIETTDLFDAQISSPVAQEAVYALVQLGFSKKNSEQIVQKITKSKPDITVEQLVKLGIQNMSN